MGEGQVSQSLQLLHDWCVRPNPPFYRRENMATIELIFAIFLSVFMITLLYVGLHLNKPMFWEEGGFLDKLKTKKK